MVSTMSMQDRAAKVRENALQQFCVMAAEAEGNEIRQVVDQAVAFITTTDEAAKLAESCQSTDHRNLVVQRFVQAGKVRGVEDALAMAELVDTDERWGREAMQAIRVQATPWLVIEDVDLEYVEAVLKLAHKLGVPRTVHQSLGQDAGKAIADNFDDPGELVAYLDTCSCGEAHNAALAAFARSVLEAEEVLTLADGHKLLDAVVPRLDGEEEGTRLSIVNAMIPALRADGVTYDEIVRFGERITSNSDSVDDSREAEEALVAVTATHITTTAGAVNLSFRLHTQTGAHRVLSGYVDRAVESGGLPNVEAVLAICMAIKSDRFGGRELRAKLAEVCRNQGFDFDPYAWVTSEQSGDESGGLPRELEELLVAAMQSGARRG